MVQNGNKRKVKKKILLWDIKIHKNKYYAWYYKNFEDIHVLPIGYFTLEHARYTLELDYGKKIFQTLKISRGELLLKRGCSLGTNYLMWEGKRRRIRGFAIPREWAVDQYSRKHFRRLLKRKLRSRTKSAVNRTLELYYGKTYQRRSREV